MPFDVLGRTRTTMIVKKSNRNAVPRGIANLSKNIRAKGSMLEIIHRE